MREEFERDSAGMFKFVNSTVGFWYCKMITMLMNVKITSLKAPAILHHLLHC